MRIVPATSGQSSFSASPPFLFSSFNSILQRAMAFSGVSFPSLNHHHVLQSPNVTRTSLAPRKPDPPLSPSQFCAATTTASSSEVKWGQRLAFSLGRRILSLSIVGSLVSLDQPFSSFLSMSEALASQEQLELVRYTDSTEGFTLLVPTSWIKVEKAGATVLFEDANKKANNVGVVVSPTRISNLGEFGTPEFVADKLIQAERRKESTKEAEVISISERLGQGGIEVYEFEYKVDSTRGGLKRVFSAAFVASKKLYLLNITQSTGSDNPLDMDRRMMLEQVLHSFDSVSSA